MTEGLAVIHERPGAPIELMLWADGGVVRRLTISDRRALQIAADLVEAVLSNQKEIGLKISTETGPRGAAVEKMES